MPTRYLSNCSEMLLTDVDYISSPGDLSDLTPRRYPHRSRAAHAARQP